MSFSKLNTITLSKIHGFCDNESRESLVKALLSTNSHTTLLHSWALDKKEPFHCIFCQIDLCDRLFQDDFFGDRGWANGISQKMLYRYRSTHRMGRRIAKKYVLRKILTRTDLIELRNMFLYVASQLGRCFNTVQPEEMRSHIENVHRPFDFKDTTFWDLRCGFINELSFMANSAETTLENSSQLYAEILREKKNDLKNVQAMSSIAEEFMNKMSSSISSGCTASNASWNSSITELGLLSSLVRVNRKIEGQAKIGQGRRRGVSTLALHQMRKLFFQVLQELILFPTADIHIVIEANWPKFRGQNKPRKVFYRIQQD